MATWGHNSQRKSFNESQPPLFLSPSAKILQKKWYHESPNTNKIEK